MIAPLHPKDRQMSPEQKDIVMRVDQSLAELASIDDARRGHEIQSEARRVKQAAQQIDAIHGLTNAVWWVVFAIAVSAFSIGYILASNP